MPYNKLQVRSLRNKFLSRWYQRTGILCIIPSIKSNDHTDLAIPTLHHAPFTNSSVRCCYFFTRKCFLE
ncbi:uncharacterized protein EAE98_004153 [Botrytis deweyae]|uniref:Uncharacterized protein n=1 Tax=Botrytis deweyae TaxID=2478750 RepID=A0ABQ7ISS7_9HELO|nr:uncharacterized protein EAE98_004153 [Botrytis deweyae]KAF7932854.1 hypothetical protein EAE98_004153 [Botrytis deweyae]